MLLPLQEHACCGHVTQRMRMQGDAPAAARRPAALPRSISDISETHSLQGYASLRDHGSATDVSPLPSSLPGSLKMPLQAGR